MKLTFKKSSFLLFTLFFGLFLSNAYAENKLITTPYFKVMLPDDVVQMDIETARFPGNSIGKIYKYIKENKADKSKADYELVVLVASNINMNGNDEQTFLTSDLMSLFLNWAVKVNATPIDGISTIKMIDVKVGKQVFKTTRSADGMMEAWVTFNKGQFYRFGIMTPDPQTMDMIHKLMTESLELTDTPIQEKN